MKGSYNIHQENSSVTKELERLEAQTLLSWEKEAGLMSLYGLKDEMRVLEIGCGPGYVSNRLLSVWPNIDLTSIDVEDEMIKRAKENTHFLPGNKSGFIVASVTDMPLEDDVVDFAIARFVFQHVEDLASALSEVLRVLKPGGKLVISEIDPELWGRVYPYEAGLDNIYKSYAEEQRKNGGDRFVIRNIPQELKKSGFRVTRTDVYSYDSNEKGLEPFLPQLSPNRYEPLLEKGIIDLFDFAVIQAAYNRFLENPDAYVMLLGVMMCCEK